MIRLHELENGHLLIKLEDAEGISTIRDREGLDDQDRLTELLEYSQYIGNGYDIYNAGLWGAPIIGYHSEYKEEKGGYISVKSEKEWTYMWYESKDFMEELLKEEFVIFDKI